jgi:beta-lactam-binding protein with PASTA domain
MKRVRILIAMIAAFLIIVPAALAQVKPQPVPVPNVAGMPLSAAQQALVSAGFNALVTQENVTDPNKNNIVLKQQIPPGTTLAKGSNVPVVVGKYTAPAQQPVPNATGMKITDAQGVLQQKGWKTAVSGRPVTDSRQAGIVLEQSPRPGTQAVPDKTTVTLTIGEFKNTAVVPNVVGKPLADAQRTLVEARLNAAVTQENVADPGKNNVVLKQQIAAGAALAPGAQVPLIVGRYEEMVKVPNVVGMPKNQAISALAAAGLQSGALTTTVKEQNKHDVVMSQQVPAGTMMRKGATVPISLGFYTAPVVLDTVVPNVVGMNYDQARAALEKAGFNWNNVQAFRKVVDDTKLSAGVIRAQDPAAGKKIPKTERVTLWGEIYEQRAKVAVPNVDKLTVEEAKQRIEAAGLYWGLSYKPTPTHSLNERVIEQAPAPGTLISKGESVKFTVGRFTAGELEINMNHMAGMHTYLMQIRGGTPPYDVRIQYDIAKAMAGQDAVKAIGLNDSASYPGWKLYRITPKPGVDTKVSFIIKDATGKTKQYSAQIKYF